MIPLAILAAGLLIAGAVVFAAQFEQVIRSRRGHKVIVTCKNGNAWRGHLAQTDRRIVVLRNTERLSGSDAVIVDGEVLLDRADIDFMQRP